MMEAEMDELSLTVVLLKNIGLGAELTKWLEQVSKGQGGQGRAPVRAGHFWGLLQGALNQFIDIQGFDPVTTGMSLRLRQPCLSLLCLCQKQRGLQAEGSPPSPSTRLPWWAKQACSTLSQSCGHILPFFLFFFLLPLSFFPAASPRRFLSSDKSYWVTDIHVCTQTHRL